MENVIALNVPHRLRGADAGLSALLYGFAHHRRFGDDVFWLKENAEVLNILECTGTDAPEAALAAYEDFYEGAARRLAFFPQYYRFLLSITLDLEALGMPGSQGARMIDWALSEALPEGELSDLQRMEARRLMVRRGRVALPGDAGLEARMRAFIAQTRIFALPNKKAAYELTHAVFYLAEYGRRDPELSGEARTSLHFAGLLAYLEQNADLLAEVCLALRYAGEFPPVLWTGWLSRETHLFRIEVGDEVSVADDYHEYLVCNWHEAASGGRIFAQDVPQGRMRFDRSATRVAPLREVSEAMYRLDDRRSGDWGAMRDLMEDALSPEALGVLMLAEASSDRFDAFFEGFARAGRA